MEIHEGLSIVSIGGLLMFLLAFSIGANDVGNSIGPVVGALVLSLVQAITMASFFESGGALLLGDKVSTTIRDKVIAPSAYFGDDDLFALCMFSTLAGSMIWVFAATLLKLPVSGTHATIGAVVGTALVTRGPSAVNWGQIGFIAASWVTSPIFAGLTSTALFWLLRRFVMRTAYSYERGLLITPVFYGLIFGLNAYLILPSSLGILLTLLITFLISLFTAVAVWFVVVPVTRTWIALSLRHDRELQPDEPTMRLYLNSICDYTTRSWNLNNPDDGSLPPSAERMELTEYGSDDGNESHDHILNNFQERDDDDDDEEEDYDESDDTLDDSSTPLSRTASPSGVVFPKAANLSSSTQSPTHQIPADGETVEGEGDEDIVEDVLAKAAEKDRPPDYEVETFHQRGEAVFGALLVLTSAFACFAHGANDLANAMAPFAAIWAVYTSGYADSASLDYWILVVACLGLVTGLVLLGAFVTATIGKNLTVITPCRGFAIQFGTALAVTLASAMGLPISTTQSQVGAVVAVGFLEGRNNVNWKLVGEIAASWLVTLPIAGALAAAVVLMVQALSGW